jgi:hypothetical protein
MAHRSFHADLGSFLNKLFTLVIFLILFHFFGDSVADDIAIALISIASYPLVGMFLRSIGVWRY